MTLEIAAETLMRIAHLFAGVAENWTALTAERDRYKLLYHKQLRRCSDRDRTISALRGVITRMKGATQ